jgi:biotin carboxyl carrier protein
VSLVLSASESWGARNVIGEPGDPDKVAFNEKESGTETAAQALMEAPPLPSTEPSAPIPAERQSDEGKDRPPSSLPVPSIIVAAVAGAVVLLSIWYLVRPEPLLVQGEVDATLLDIAARVDGRVGDIPVQRGQDVRAGAVLVHIDNPETLAKLNQAFAAKVVGCVS